MASFLKVFSLRTPHAWTLMGIGRSPDLLDGGPISAKQLDGKALESRGFPGGSVTAKMRKRNEEYDPLMIHKLIGLLQYQG